MVLEKTLGSPWTARRSDQSIVKEINPEYLLEGLMLKLKPQYFGHLMRRADSLEKTLMLEKIGGKRRGQHRMRWLDGITEPMEMSLSKLQEIVEKAMATQSSTLFWRVPWMEEPGRPQSMGSRRVGQSLQLKRFSSSSSSGR